MSFYHRSTLYFLALFPIRLAEARSRFGTQSTYLHPIGGTEIEHQLGRKNTRITATFELFLLPSESITSIAEQTYQNLLILRILNAYKQTGASAFFISPEIITAVKIHDYEVVNSGRHPNQPMLSLELREVSTFKKLSNLLTGVALGSAALVPEGINKALKALGGL